MTVVDASVLVAALADSGHEGSNVLRRLERSEQISRIEATGAHDDLLRLVIQRFPFAPFAEREWALRGGLASYDAWHVALAEGLDCPFVMLDRRLSRETGPICEIIAPPHPPD